MNLSVHCIPLEDLFSLNQEEEYKFNLALLREESQKLEIDKSKTQEILAVPTRPITTKRKPSLSNVTNSNQSSAKKAGRSMISLTKHFKSKRKKKQS